MIYTVQQLAKLAGVSVRTLHHYDQIKLLSPVRQANGYRQYAEAELLKLQQILFFRELDFPLEDIKRIMSDSKFNMKTALDDQKKMLELKKKRLSGLIKTIEKTMLKITNQTTMNDDQLYGSFSNDEVDQYAAEAKQRWGNTEAYKQSQERVKKMGKEGMQKVKEAGEQLCRELADSMNLSPADEKVQALVQRHFDGLRAFYEPSLEMYRNLGEMYVDDTRFTAYYDKFAPGLAVFLRDAIRVYCDARK